MCESHNDCDACYEFISCLDVLLTYKVLHICIKDVESGKCVAIMRIYIANPKIPIAAIKIHCDMANKMRWTGLVLQSPFILLGKEYL
jgi:hypothetical protein